MHLLSTCKKKSHTLHVKIFSFVQQKVPIYKQQKQKTLRHKTYPPGIKSLCIYCPFLTECRCIYIIQNYVQNMLSFLELFEV